MTEILVMVVKIEKLQISARNDKPGHEKSLAVVIGCLKK